MMQSLSELGSYKTTERDDIPFFSLDQSLPFFSFWHMTNFSSTFMLFCFAFIDLYLFYSVIDDLKQY